MSGTSNDGGRTPHCPTCEAELHYERGDVAAWLCPEGHGVAVTLPAARRRVEDDVVNQVWGKAYRAPAGLRACPFCADPMTPVVWHLVPGDDATKVELDLCRDDQLLWFDVGELEALPEAQRVDEDDDELVISHPWASAADNLPSWTQRVVGRGIVRGVGVGVDPQ
ncbi:MAG: hypothetical protein R2746_03580 [Acidimicrobiales bacterium]